ncbi:MAG: MFS transporter [Chloroflexi bacterium]|nr:MFS transporter [Chloroflexota bacterium]
MRLWPRSLYYGWVVAGASGSIGFANAASAISILTIFVVPMSEEFGWGRTEIAGATTLGAILGAALAPFIGRLVDRFGSRLTLVIGGSIIGLGCVYLSLMQTLAGFYIAFTVSRIADQGGVKIGASVAAGKWFERYRGRATGLVFLVETVGVIALAPLTQLVIGQWGWRSAWLMLAAVMFLLGVIPCALWVRRQPEDMGLAVDGDSPLVVQQAHHERTDSEHERAVTEHERTVSDHERTVADGEASGAEVAVEERSLTLRDAARTPAFWIALASLFLGSNAVSGPGLHLVPYLTERGLNVAAAVGAISVMATAGAAGAMLAGIAADRWSPRWLMAALYLMSAAALTLLVGTDTLAETYAVVILMGLIGTGINTLAPLMWAANYGRGSLGAIHGVGRATQVLGFAVGPLVSGIAYDSTGTYREVFLALAGVAVVAAGLMAAARTGRAHSSTGSKCSGGH